MPYTCPICGEEHTDLPHVGSAAPFQWTDEHVNDPSSLLTKDLCIIEGRDYFVHGVIEIPVHDYRPFPPNCRSWFPFAFERATSARCPNTRAG